MKTIIAAVVAVAALGGCVAVPAYEPAPYYSAGPAYYYPAPAVSFYYSNRGGGYYGHHRHW